VLEIRLLGPPNVTVEGAPIRVDTRKAIALLAYLAVQGDVTRDGVATVFWAESASDRARATLRRTLSALRAGVGGEMIIADRNRIALADGYWADTDEFESALAATVGHGHDSSDVCPDCLPDLERATGLYRGDFLVGFSIRDAPGFEDWARNLAESFRIRAGEAFNRLAIGRAAAGQYPEAIAAAAKWIDLDSLHEPAHRLLMLLHAWAGDRPGAIETYQNFVAILDRELGVPPLGETTELYAAILDEDLPPAPGVRRRIRAEHVERAATSSELIGRQREHETLRDSMDAVARGGRVVAITGATWMGKTRLLEDLAAEAGSQGLQVLFGRAFRAEQGLPYGVVTQMLRSGLLEVQGVIGEVPDWARAEVTRLVPELGPTPAVTTDRFGELRLYEGVRSVLDAVAARGRLVLLIDDIQWIDPASAGLISYFARRIAETPVLLALASRAGEPLLEAVAELIRSADAVLTLEPLGADELLPVAGDAARAEELRQRTGGIPLLVLEALAVTNGSNGDTPVVFRYTESRLSHVGDLSRQVLAAASVLDGVCDAGLLRATSGRSEEEIVDTVEELVGAGLLREVPETEGLAFTLDAVEKVVYDSTSLIRRRLLHRRAALALAERPRARTDARLAATVGAHHQAAGDPIAATWFRSAGDLSREMYANTEARGLYETAIALGGSQEAELRLALGELAMTEGAYEIALRHLTSANVSARDATSGLVQHRLGEVQRLLGRFALAEEHFEKALPTHPQPAEVYSDWALLCHRIGQRNRALELAEKALNAAADAGDPVQLSRVHNILGVVTPDSLAAISHLDEAIELAGDDDLLRMAALNNQALLRSGAGEDDTAVSLIEEAIEIAVRTGNRHREAALRNHLADLHHRAGRSKEAEDSLMQAVSLFAGVEAGDPEPEIWLLRQW